MSKRLSVILLQLFIVFTLQAHPWKPRHFVIIDTDGGLDDFRAINLILASPDVRVLGITVTPGVLSANDGYQKVKSFLIKYYHEGIPVGINYAADIQPANFAIPKDFTWGDSTVKTLGAPNAMDVLKNLYAHCSDSIKFVCLGSLSIIPLASREIPGFQAKTSGIIWSSKPLEIANNFNRDLDKAALKKVQSLSVPLAIVNGESFAHSEIFNSGFLIKMKDKPIPCKEDFERSLNTNHAIYFDENVALWLHFPNYFDQVKRENFSVFSGKTTISQSELQEAFLKILAGETVSMNQVLNAFSTDTSDYFPDVRPIMLPTLQKYGKDEWVAEVMGNELHRHLGVFAIVGAKMGIRAKEYFGAGVDEMKVISYAGLIPPFSCMNDGLQVSTGATLGHGLISVSGDSLVRPVADFTYMGRTIRLTLKPFYAKKIASEVKELNGIYGLNSNIYWELIRKLAIKYWANFNRHEIFTIEELTAAK